MSENTSYISLNLDLREPVEIGDFAATFAGLDSQFEAYIAKYHPELKGHAKMYVREVRKGSIIADLFPNIPNLIGYMDSVLIIIGFTGIFSKQIKGLVSGKFIEGATKSDLKEIGEIIRAVSNDSGGQMVIDSLVYRDGVFSKEFGVSLTTTDSRSANKTLERQKLALDKKTNTDYERVLMVFTRPDVFDAKIDKKSGEQVIINDIASNPKPLIYGSKLAEDKIKEEIRSEDSVFNKGFVVDVNVQVSAAGNPIAYSITHLHQIIDLAED